MRPFHKLARGAGVADRGRGIDAEHGGKVQAIGAVGEGLFELPIDAEPLQRGGQPTQTQQPCRADGVGFARGSGTDHQAPVRGVGPTPPTVIKPAGNDLEDQVVQRPRKAGDGQMAVTEIDVVELQAADRRGAGGTG